MRTRKAKKGYHVAASHHEGGTEHSMPAPKTTRASHTPRASEAQAHPAPEHEGAPGHLLELIPAPQARIDDHADPPVYHDEHDAPAERPSMPDGKPQIDDPTDRTEKHAEVPQSPQIGKSTRE